MLLLLQMMKRMLKENQIQTKREILCLLCWGGGVCVCLFTQKRSLIRLLYSHGIIQESQKSFSKYYIIIL